MAHGTCTYLPISAKQLYIQLKSVHGLSPKPLQFNSALLIAQFYVCLLRSKPAKFNGLAPIHILCVLDGQLRLFSMGGGNGPPQKEELDAFFRGCTM